MEAGVEAGFQTHAAGTGSGAVNTVPVRDAATTQEPAPDNPGGGTDPSAATGDGNRAALQSQPVAPAAPQAPEAQSSIEQMIRPRVDKVRQVSQVVLNEASYDPSLRFVLIAAVLFLIAVALVIISQYLR
jgi:hypothetical protein